MFVDTINYNSVNRKSNAIKMNVSAFSKIFCERICKIHENLKHKYFMSSTYSLFRAPPRDQRRSDVISRFTPSVP